MSVYNKSFQSSSSLYLKGGGYGKIYADFAVQIFSLDGVVT